MDEKGSIRSDAQKLRRRNQELSILNAIAQALNQSIDLDQALHAVLAQVAELFDLETGWVWLLREDTSESYLAAQQRLPPALARKPERMEGGCTCLSTFRDGDLSGAANVNIVACSRLHGLVDGTDGLRYHASIPLYAHGRKMGVLNVASTDWRELTPDELQLLYTIGDMLGIAVERARLFDRSTRLGALEERNRLAREIHDTLAQGLTAVALQIESADALLEAGAAPKRVQQALQHALELTRANLEEARRSVMDLRAAPLENGTLTEAVGALAHDSPVPVHFEVVGGERPLSPRIEAGLYRIVQEGLTNVARHAEATQAWLRLTLTPVEVHLVLEDDGKGFEPTHAPQKRYGLVGLNERVKLLNGRFHLESAPGEGTRLEVFIPLS